MSDAIFLKAIRSNPDDDLPRLVYADWLEERGHGTRAEFIRVQCELAQTPEHEPRYRLLEDREHELLSQHEPEFLGSSWPRNWQIGPTEWTWKRGFLDEVSINFGNLLQAGYLSEHPVRALSISSDFGQPTELLEQAELHPLLSGLQQVWLDGWNSLKREAVTKFFGSPRLEQLNKFDLGDRSNLWESLEILIECPELASRLSHLSCNVYPGNDLENTYENMEVSWNFDALERNQTELVRRVKFPRLISLSTGSISWGGPSLLNSVFSYPIREQLQELDIISLDDETCSALTAHRVELPVLKRLSAFCHSSHCSNNQLLLFTKLVCDRLQELKLSTDHFGIAEAQILRQLSCWPSLQVLNLSYGLLASITLQELLNGPDSPYLRHLTLEESRLGTNGVLELFNFRSLQGLVSLVLGRTDMGNFPLSQLQRNGSFPELRKLHLTHCGLTAPGLQSLVNSRHLTNLRELNLSGGSFGATTRELLEADQWSLATLCLLDSELTDDFIEALAKWPKLGRLTDLMLDNNTSFTEAALLKLAESPYLSPLCELSLIGCGISDRVREAFQERLGPRFSG